jgi:hypothetical protein
MTVFEPPLQDCAPGPHRAERRPFTDLAGAAPACVTMGSLFVVL